MVYKKKNIFTVKSHETWSVPSVGGLCLVSGLLIHFDCVKYLYATMHSGSLFGWVPSVNFIWLFFLFFLPNQLTHLHEREGDRKQNIYGDGLIPQDETLVIRFTGYKEDGLRIIFRWSPVMLTDQRNLTLVMTNSVLNSQNIEKN